MTKSTKVHGSLFLVALIYAATFSIAKEVMPHYIKPMGLITIRVWGAVSLLWVTHFLFVKESIFGKKDFLMLLKCAVFGVAANMLLFFKGLAITTPINAAILMVTTPLFVAFFSFFLLNEKVTKLKVIGLCFGVFGAILLLLGPSLSFNSTTLWGDLMVMTNAIIYAYYLIVAKPLLHKYSPITVIKWTFFFGGLLVIPFGFTELKEVVEGLGAYLPENKAPYIWDMFVKLNGVHENRPCTCASAGGHWKRAVDFLLNYVKNK